MRTARVKEILRSVFGDRITAWVHALRFLILAHGRGHEPEDMLFAQNVLRDGDVAVDVGANGANWTRVLSKAVGARGRVFAFEADPYYADVTKKAICLMRLDNVTFFGHGLSNRTETAHLEVYDENNNRVSGQGTVIRDIDVYKTQKSIDNFVLVNLMPLDNLAQKYPDILKTKLLKCDVEGFELMVFEGARKVLNIARPIIIAEVGGSHKHGYADEDLFLFFDELNYNSFVAVSGSLLRASRHAGAIPEGQRPNRIMIPRERDMSALNIRLDTHER